MDATQTAASNRLEGNQDNEMLLLQLDDIGRATRCLHDRLTIYIPKLACLLRKACYKVQFLGSAIANSVRKGVATGMTEIPRVCRSS